MGFKFRPHCFSLLLLSFSVVVFAPIACSGQDKEQFKEINNISLIYKNYEPSATDLMISREAYLNNLYGFWLGTCIGNWTGLITEMDKIGNIGEIKTGLFYTRADWGQPDQPSIWGQGVPSNLSPVIDFVFASPDSIWGADDDTDIEYIYQELLLANHVSVLSGKQIRDGWLKHIKPEEENYLWVSNQTAYDLMSGGLIPPETGSPQRNPHFDMIDAQLTTEIFGLFAPAKTEIALKMAFLPVRNTASQEAAMIAEFYIAMFSLASQVNDSIPMKDRIFLMAEEARKQLPHHSYPAKMYDFVLEKYKAGFSWEQTRDSLYMRYQVKQTDGYEITSRNLYCNGCFAAGINFAASLVSLFYGEGDFIETVKIGSLAGWDSDNPTATWAGLIGFMIGKEGIEKAFGQSFSDKFHIHRTRINFPDNGIDNFKNMARKGIMIIDRVVQEEMGGGIDLDKNVWYIPQN